MKFSRLSILCDRAQNTQNHKKIAIFTTFHWRFQQGGLYKEQGKNKNDDFTEISSVLIFAFKLWNPKTTVYGADLPKLIGGSVTNHKFVTDLPPT